MPALGSRALAFQEPERPPPENLGVRIPPQPQARILEPAPAPAAARLRTPLPQVKMDLDWVTEAPKFILAPDGFLIGPNGERRGVLAEAAQAFADQDPQWAVKAFLADHAELFGRQAEVLNRAHVKTRASSRRRTAVCAPGHGNNRLMAF